LRDALLADAPITPLVLDGTVDSMDGTRKFRFRTHDDRFIEAVLIPDDKLARSKLTLCVSCQVGCAWGCTFCATATLGFGRNLSAGEMLEQLYWIMEYAGQKPTNVVFMGMGEPLHNFDQVARTLANMEHPWGAGLSPRRLTVSTSGVVTGIDLLGKLHPPPNLAISLHATTDEVRNRIMPVNRRWNIASLLAAAKRFPLGHHRRVTFEYILLAGVNDSDVDAARLPRLLNGIPSKINLIPWNPVPGLPYERPSEERILAFQNKVRRADLPVYIRTPRGDDSAAACGQLAAQSVRSSPSLVEFKPSRRVS
jgi:23S rRNA (adenine2503-C2)-methyltransferase